MSLKTYTDTVDWGDETPAVQRPYEVAFDKALKETVVLREHLSRLRDAIKPALQPEAPEKLVEPESAIPDPPKSPVVRDFDNLRHEIVGLIWLVQSINNRVHL